MTTGKGGAAVPTRRPRTVVTGAAARVGLAVAKEFSRRGHDVVMMVRTSDARADAALAAVRSAGGVGEISLLACDLNDPVAVAGAGAALAGSPIDVFVHCAAIYKPASVGSITAEAALCHYRVNALAPLLLVQVLQRALAASILPGGGAVILFSDMHVQGRFYADHAAYFASKGAVDALVGALAVELGPSVRCNAIASGVVAFPEGSDPGFMSRYIGRTPLGRAGTVEEAAQCAAWLAIEATFVSGEIIRLDGGRFHR